MHLRLASTFLLLTLMIFAAPAFSHSGHSNLFHSHFGIEYCLALFIIAGFIYRHFKNQ